MDFSLYNLYRRVVSAIILASLGYVLVHYFDSTIFLNYSTIIDEV